MAEHLSCYLSLRLARLSLFPTDEAHYLVVSASEPMLPLKNELMPYLQHHRLAYPMAATHHHLRPQLPYRLNALLALHSHHRHGLHRLEQALPA